MTFKEFNLKQELNQAIEQAGFKEPSPIQADAIPLILDGNDLVGQAHTGTGKTAAFGLPILNMINLNKGVKVLVIVPTRELAMQVSDELFKFGKFLGINTATVYGGQSYTRQIKHIENSAIVVATPGRLLDLLKGKKGFSIDIDPDFVVLDEADEMLDMGFLEDIKDIFKYISAERQTLMFSATMPDQIKKLAKTILKDPKFVTITKSEITNSKILQSFYVVEEYERDEALIRLLDYLNPEKAIIFCRMKVEVDRLASYLVAQGYAAKGLHGDMEQKTREIVIGEFKKDKLEILIATDVAARGLDVNNVSHVFNYHIPYESESYVHRIGRTGRAGKDGNAISLVTPREFHSLNKIKKMTGGNIEAKVIPTIQSLQGKKTDELIERINNHDVSDRATLIMDKLLESNSMESIAYILASIVSESSIIQGKDKIGRNLSDIKYLMDRAKNDRNGNGGRGGRNRGGRNRSGGGGYRGGSKNSSRNGGRSHRSSNRNHSGNRGGRD